MRIRSAWPHVPFRSRSRRLLARDIGAHPRLEPARRCATRRTGQRCTEPSRTRKSSKRSPTRAASKTRSSRTCSPPRHGTTLPISFTAAPVRVGKEITGLVIAFRDITRREAAEAEKTSWLNLVDAVYHVHDELGIGTLIVDDGRIHYANDAFRTISGYSLEAIKAEVP